MLDSGRVRRQGPGAGMKFPQVNHQPICFSGGCSGGGRASLRHPACCWRLDSPRLAFFPRASCIALCSRLSTLAGRFSWAADGCAADSCEGRGVRSERVEMKYVSDEQRRPSQEDQANGFWPTESLRLSSLRWLAYLVLLGFLVGCSTHPYRNPADREASIRALEQTIRDQSGQVSAFEAGLVARMVVEHAELLTRQYRLVRPPWRHNLYVNFGLKRRGLCHHWTADLLAIVGEQHFETLEFRWAIARGGTPREHNSMVVLPRGRPFRSGLVLDPWRRSGRMVWAPVQADRYPWEEADWKPGVP